MSRILLVDDSPHAQRMGERILSEEGYEVVTVSNADSALIRMEDVDPDVVLADTVMPGRSGYDICQFVKMSPRHKHVRVVLTAGVLEPLDEEQVKRVQADATVQKPFEASLLIATVKPLVERAVQDRTDLSQAPAAAAAKPAAGAKAAAVPFAAVIDAEQIRAAVTVAMDAAMETMVEEITVRVLAALQPRKPSAAAAASIADIVAPVKTAPPVPTTMKPAPPKPAIKPIVEEPAAAIPATVLPPAAATPAAVTPAASAPAAAAKTPPPRLETVRRVNPLRSRPGSILGLDFSYSEPEVPASAPPAPGPDPLFPNARPAADPDPAPRGSLSGSRPAGKSNPEPGSRPASSDSK